ncbi:hypothetical protein LXI96_000807 [Neisseria gonorrhoeae]
MVLIDRITRYGDDFVEAGAQVKPDHILLAGGMLPYTAFIELMAQAVGAYAGIQARKNARPVRLGFLPGTRKLEIFAQSVPVGTHLPATAHMSIQDAGVWACPTANCVGRMRRKLRPEHSLQTAFWHAPHSTCTAPNTMTEQLTPSEQAHIRRTTMTETVLITGSNRGIGKAAALGFGGRRL